MNVLFISPEVSPIVKTGGLGDVVGSLPPAFQNSGIDVRILCPLHRECQDLALVPLKKEIVVNWDGKKITGKIFLHTSANLKIYLLDIPSLYDRSGIYSDENGNYPDNALRSIALCQASIQLETVTLWTPDIFHAHDWMAAPVPAFLNATKKSRTRTAKSILTIHNLEHQGVFSYEDFEKVDFPTTIGEWMDLNIKGNLICLKAVFSTPTKLPQSVPPMHRKFVRFNMVAD